MVFDQLIFALLGLALLMGILGLILSHWDILLFTLFITAVITAPFLLLFLIDGEPIRPLFGMAFIVWMALFLISH